MSDSTAYRIGPLVLHPYRQLLQAGQRLPLGSKALALITVLARAEGRLVTKDELMAAVWGGLIVEENAIQVHIAALRKAMGPAAERLVTVRGLGYRLETGTETEPSETLPRPDGGAARAVVLAVLPFDNLTSDPELAFFCDGVSEEILTRVTRHAGLSTIGRTSSFQFRGADKAQAAASLKASHVLDGSIQRSGSRIRVSAHLIDSASQASLWSDRFDRELGDIFAVQDEIAGAIARALQVNFAGPELPPVDPAIYDLYLRAKERVTSPAAMERNIASLRKVTARAPHFAAGWATLAYRRAELAMHSPYAARAALRDEIAQDLAEGEARDPLHPDLLAARWLLTPPYGALARQEVVLTIGAAINPDFVDLLTTRAYFLECAGRSAEAVEEAERAARLDALNPFAVGLLGQALWFAGNHDRAIAMLEFVRNKWPDSHHSVAVLIQAYVHRQDWAAVDRLTQPARLAVHPLREHVGVVAFARVMRSSDARHRRAMFEMIRKRADDSGCIDPQVAVVAAELGFVDETYDLLARSRFGPCGGPHDVMGTHAYRTLLLFPQAYQALRADPRFVAVCARLGLVKYWLDSGHWPDCADQVPYDFRAACIRAADTPVDPWL
ncbi:MAG: winged helix-turn-helix domain-containing protein [Novosphingobium sp.]